MTARKKKIKDVFRIPELRVAFDKGNFVDFPRNISQSRDVADLLRGLFDEGEIELHEVMFVIYMNRANEPIGFYKHSIGGISATVFDNRIILAAALKCLSSALIVCHNHPSGNSSPSDEDIQQTKKLKEVAGLVGIHVLDHIILTKNNYTSLADQGIMGVESPYPITSETFILTEKNPTSIAQTEKLAKELARELRKL